MTQYPKWKYRIDPVDGKFQATLVGNAQSESEIGDSWTDDPHVHGIEVVPTFGQADASGKVAFGPKPSVPGMTSAKIGI
jgi:hypothetical protein